MATFKTTYLYNAKGEIAVCDIPEQVSLNESKGFTLSAAPPGTGDVAMYNKDGDCALAKTPADKERLAALGYGYEYVAEKPPAEPPKPGSSSLDSEAFRALIGEIGGLRARVESIEAQLTEPKKGKKEVA